MKRCIGLLLLLCALSGCGADPGALQREIDNCEKSGRYAVVEDGYRVYCTKSPQCSD